MLFFPEILHESIQAREAEVCVSSGQEVFNYKGKPSAVPVLPISEMSRPQHVCPKTRYVHYINKPFQNTAIFKTVKIDNFHMKKCDIFLIFAQNIDCGYMLTSTHKLCVRAKIRKCIPL